VAGKKEERSGKERGKGKEEKKKISLKFVCFALLWY